VTADFQFADMDSSLDRVTGEDNKIKILIHMPDFKWQPGSAPDKPVSLLGWAKRAGQDAVGACDLPPGIFLMSPDRSGGGVPAQPALRKQSVARVGTTGGALEAASNPSRCVRVAAIAPIDSNWPAHPPDDAGGTGDGSGRGEPAGRNHLSVGSIIECQTQILGEKHACDSQRPFAFSKPGCRRCLG
jgi:hypothetical protein